MNDQNSLLTSPQLENYEQLALALTAKQVHSLYKKSKTSGIPLEVLEQVYCRGVVGGDSGTGFARVDSFIHGGEAARLDQDLAEGIKAAAKLAARDAGNRAAPGYNKLKKKYKKMKNNRYVKALRENVVVQGEPQSDDPNEPAGRFIGTDRLTQHLKNSTPGQGDTPQPESRLDVIKRIVREKSAKKEE